MVTIGKEPQNFLAVVTDGGEFDALLFKSRNGTLQLDQLPLAKRSPIGGTKEKKNGSISTSERVERLPPPELVEG